MGRIAMANDVVETDRSPDPKAAQAVGLEFRRRLMMSYGINVFYVGMMMVAWGLAVVFLENSLPKITAIFLIMFFPSIIIIKYVIGRGRSRRGLNVAVRDYMPKKWGKKERSTWTAALFFLGLVTGLVCYRSDMKFDNVVLTALYILIFVFLWDFAATKLWELLLMGCGFIVAAKLFVIGYSMGLIVLVVGAAFLLSGLFLHMRWTRWVRSMAGDTIE
jgi:hypothetical protein